MPTEENKAVVIRHLKDVLEAGHVELIPSYYAPDGTDPDMDTPEQWKDRVLWHHKHCPGLKITILDIMAEENKVMVHCQVDLTYSVPEDPPDPFSYPLGKPVSWRIMEVFTIANGMEVSHQIVNNYYEMLVTEEVIPLEKIKHNRVMIQKFVDALNRQDAALLREVATPEMAKEWEEGMAWLHSTMKDHHIDLTDWVVDGDSVAVKMATCGYHTGELFGLSPTGKWWTNRVFTFFSFKDGKIAQVDALPDIENHIKQIGGVIQPVRA